MGSLLVCSLILAHLLQLSTKLFLNHSASRWKQRGFLHILPAGTREELVLQKSIILRLAPSKCRQRNSVLPHYPSSRCGKAVQESAASWASIPCITLMLSS